MFHDAARTASMIFNAYSVFNSSLSSPIDTTLKPHQTNVSNFPTHGFCGLHKSQRIENFQYYNSSSGESINQI